MLQLNSTCRIQVFTLCRNYNACSRLSTIRTADKIVAIKDGQVVETGSHEDLMSSKGLYYSLVQAQTNQDLESLDVEDEPGSWMYSLPT